MTANSDEIRSLTKGLRIAARVLEIASICGAVGGAFWGLRVAWHVDRDLGGHPWLGIGIAIAIGSVVGGIFNFAISRALQIFAVDTASRHGVNVEDLRTTMEKSAASPRVSNPTTGQQTRDFSTGSFGARCPQCGQQRSIRVASIVRLVSKISRGRIWAQQGRAKFECMNCGHLW